MCSIVLEKYTETSYLARLTAMAVPKISHSLYSLHHLHTSFTQCTAIAAVIHRNKAPWAF